MNGMRPISMERDAEQKGAAENDRSLRSRLLSEPLVHFAIIGSLLFAGYQALGGDRGVESDRIVIDDSTVGVLLQQFSSNWRRMPTRQEMKAMLDTYVRDEALYRQGLAMGLDKDDLLIRNRVLQKLQVIAEESRQSDPPDDAELEKFMRAHASDYASPPVLTFTQVYFDPAQHGKDIEKVTSDALAALRNGESPSRLGDPSLLPRVMTRQPSEMLAHDFGEEFPAGLAKHPIGEWFGPVRSGVGLHLIRISERIDGEAPKLADVRDTVLRDWEAERRKRNAQAYSDDVRKDYEVVVNADLPRDVLPDGAAR